MNRVKPVHASRSNNRQYVFPTIHPVTYERFWQRRCTSVEKEMILFSARTIWLWVPRDGDKWNLPVIDQKSFVASASSRIESSWRGFGEESPSDSPRKTSCSSPRGRWSLIEVDGFRRRSPPEVLTVPSATGNKKLSPLICVNTSFALSLLA